MCRNGYNNWDEAALPVRRIDRNHILSPGELAPAVLKGEVCGQFIRCNKPGCRCRIGQPHGPYFYRVWREGARVRKIYIRPEELADVRAACEMYRTYRSQLRDLRQRRELLTRDIQGHWRKTQRLLHRP